MTRQQMVLVLCALLIVLGGVLGGGPTLPSTSMLVELTACGLLGVSFAGLANGKYPADAKLALVFVVAVALVPILQLIPLPAGLWRSLPGRDIPDAISRLAGQGDVARPLTLDPDQARLRGLALIVPIAIFVATLQIGMRERDRIMQLFVLFALCSLLLGVFQLGTGNRLYLFEQSHFGLPDGFFANRNHQADLMLIAIPLVARVATMLPLHRPQRRIALIAGVLLFAMGVVATQSRTALSIMPLAVLGALFVGRRLMANRTMWIGMGSTLGLAVLGALLLLLTPVGQHTLERFSTVGEDLRPEIWRNTFVAIKEYWPAGSGLGSFVPVFDMFENLDFVSDKWVNHAHNDYLEILLETGIVGVILFVCYAALVLSRAFRRGSEDALQQRVVGLVGIAILLLHSATDYPMRTFVLLSAFAFFNGLLYPSRDVTLIRRKGSFRADPPPAFADTIRPGHAEPENA